MPVLHRNYRRVTNQDSTDKRSGQALKGHFPAHISIRSESAPPPPRLVRADPRSWLEVCRLEPSSTQQSIPDVVAVRVAIETTLNIAAHVPHGPLGVELMVSSLNA